MGHRLMCIPHLMYGHGRRRTLSEDHGFLQVGTLQEVGQLGQSLVGLDDVNNLKKTQDSLVITIRYNFRL